MTDPTLFTKIRGIERVSMPRKEVKRMPIRWSAVQVNDAMDMAEEFVNKADEPLQQALIVAQEARRIKNLPQYLDTRLHRLIDQIERIDTIKSCIKAVRDDIPTGAIEREKGVTKHGTQASLV